MGDLDAEKTVMGKVSGSALLLYRNFRRFLRFTGGTSFDGRRGLPPRGREGNAAGAPNDAGYDPGYSGASVCHRRGTMCTATSTFRGRGGRSPGLTPTTTIFLTAKSRTAASTLTRLLPMALPSRPES